jgi:hypothetical protein
MDEYDFETEKCAWCKEPKEPIRKPEERKQRLKQKRKNKE